MEVKLDDAYVKFNEKELEVCTGKMSRTWEWRENGFVTGEIKHDRYGFANPNTGCDYNIFGLTAQSGALLLGVDAHIIEEGLTSRHIEVSAITSYPELFMCVKYVIWIYPGAGGLRTQLYVKSTGNDKTPQSSGESVTETLSIPSVSRVKTAGYYNDTQNRNNADTEIIREEDFESPRSLNIGWANLFAVYFNNGGICVVKESNKCVNQEAYDTGAFIFENGALKITGAGLVPEDIRTDRYLFAWAAWTFFFDGTDDGLEAAVKEFDRLRYPVNAESDIYIMSNTWGTSDSKTARDAASAENVLKDISAAAEIGVDVVQVDDGWHSPTGTLKFPMELPWYTHIEKYPEGWETIVKPALENGLKLGLWFAWYASAEEIIDNMKQGGFRYFKIDFVNIKTREQFDGLYDKAMQLYRAGKGRIRINWDATENPARMGYYFGREFGNIYLENRKPYYPEKVVYVPYLVLRDAWQIAKYANINKFQVTLQNLDLINREASDAHLHNFTYCAMIAFMGSPILFQQVQLLSPEARRELKNIIAIYKNHRETMYRCFVYPIGSKPDNCSWTGFQFADNDNGYIVLFRERNSKVKKEKVKIKKVKNCAINAVNVITGENFGMVVDLEGYAEFTIETPCGFLWLKYQA